MNQGAVAAQLDDLEEAGVPADLLAPLRDAQGQGDFGATRDNVSSPSKPRAASASSPKC